MDIKKYAKNRVNAPGVNEVTPAPLRATVNILSEGQRLCYRCGMPIDGLAGYLDDADGRFIGVVHEKCVRPEEREYEPEPENETPELRARLQRVEREEARWYGTQFFSPRSECA